MEAGDGWIRAHFRHHFPVPTSPRRRLSRSRVHLITLTQCSTRIAHQGRRMSKISTPWMDGNAPFALLTGEPLNWTAEEPIQHARDNLNRGTWVLATAIGAPPTRWLLAAARPSPPFPFRAPHPRSHALPASLVRQRGARSGNSGEPHRAISCTTGTRRCLNKKLEEAEESSGL